MALSFGILLPAGLLAPSRTRGRILTFSNLQIGGSRQIAFLPSDPQLGPLATNGGPTANLLPDSGSPAIDAGLPTLDTPATDQRGFSRQVDTGDPDGDGWVLDIGSVEAQAP